MARTSPKGKPDCTPRHPPNQADCRACRRRSPQARHGRDDRLPVVSESRCRRRLAAEPARPKPSALVVRRTADSTRKHEKQLPARGRASRRARGASRCWPPRRRGRRRWARSPDVCRARHRRQSGRRPAAARLRRRHSSQALKAELAELAALKASLEAAARNAGTSSPSSASGSTRSSAPRSSRPPSSPTSPTRSIGWRRKTRRQRSAPETTGSIAAAQHPPAEAKLPDNVLHGLGRTRRAGRPRSGRKPLRRHVRGRASAASSGPRPDRSDQAPGRPVGGRHPPRHDHLGR